LYGKSAILFLLGWRSFFFKERKTTMSMINVNRFFTSGIKRLFTGEPREMLGELLQNAQRSGARHVSFSFPAPDTCDMKDDGHGLAQGRESLQSLLVFSESGFLDPLVEEYQRPLGMGFYALIANERITQVCIESFSPPDDHILVLAIDTVRWLSDGAYRESWQERVSLRERESRETGFRLTITGDESLISEMRACLLDTPARKVHDNEGMSGHWIRHTMSPACGYSDLLEITVDGEVLNTRLPVLLTIKAPDITATYQGNPIRISLFSASPAPFDSGNSSLIVNWFGQMIFDTSQRGWYAYLHVRSGHPVHPKSPTRAGLIDDQTLRSLYQWIEDRIFAYVCSQEQPPAALVERLYVINRERAERECPFAIVQRWKSLSPGYVFDSHDAYTRAYDGAVWNEAQERVATNESDQLGPKQVIRKSDLSSMLLLDETVTCPLAASHPAQPWNIRNRVENGTLSFEDIVLASFEIGLTSLLQAASIEAYQAVTGVPQECVHALWWRPGPPVDDYHTTTSGEWGIQTFPTPEDELECISRIEWHPLPTDAPPMFVVNWPEGYDITNCDWIIALPSSEQMVTFLQHYGYAPFTPDDDEYDESVASYARSVDDLVRSYLGDTIAGDVPLADLPDVVNRFLPEGYDARTAIWKLRYGKKTHRLQGIEVAFRRTRIQAGYKKVLQIY
jgi:hypothetical protein